MHAQQRVAPFESLGANASLVAWAPTNASLANVENACASYKTCDACVNSSYTCHFCEKDFQCHAIGSPSGCLIGISTCHHLEDCERKSPQHVGYGPPPSVVIVVLCLVVTLTCCLCGISAICSVFLRTSRGRGRYSDRKRRSGSTNGGAKTNDDSPNPAEPLLEEISEDAVLGEANRTSAGGFSWRRLWMRVLALAILVAITILALMFYPRMPDYNVCNREFEWKSVLASLTHVSPKINYDVLISVINENRFGFVLEEGRADIYHKDVWVGNWVLNQSFEATAGAISDVIAPIRLDPGYWEAYNLLTDFRNNELVFRINATVTGSITWGRHKIYRISSAVPDIEFLVGAEYDRGLCKCTEYLEPQ